MSGANELNSFHRFISEQLRVGCCDVSPEEALALWRAEHPVPYSDDDVLAIQEALQDIKGGDQGIPLEEFDGEFRQRHGLRTN